MGTRSTWAGATSIRLAVTSAARVAQEIVEQMGTPFQVRNVSLQIGASVGLCLYPDQAHDVSSLVAGADEAMYRAKLMGRGAYCFHERDEA